MKILKVPFIILSVLFTTSVLANNDIVLFANHSSTEMFNYHKYDYKHSMHNLKEKFSPTAWKKFHQAIMKSGNIDIIKNNDVVISSFPNSTAEVTPITDKKWISSTNIAVRYDNHIANVKQNLTVNLVIEKLDNSGFIITDYSINNIEPMIKLAKNKPNSCKIR